MAAAHCATAATAATISFHFPPARKRSVIVCANSTGFPSKPTKRKNYLRPKILKTLTKPYPIPHQIPPENPFIPIESPPEQQQQQQLEFTSDEFGIQEVWESDGIEIQEPPELCSDQLADHEVEGSNYIEVQQDYSSGEFSVEEEKDSAPIEQQFASHYVEGSESIDGKPGFPSDQLSGEGMMVFHSDIPFDQFASEEYDESDRLDQLPELYVDQFAGEKNAVSEVGEFSQSEETISSHELVKPVAGNPFSNISIFQIGLGFVGACVIDIIWSMWMAKKVNSNEKNQNLGVIDGNDNPKSELLLKENNDRNNNPKSELLSNENNDGNSKPNPELFPKENNDGNNIPNLELLLNANNDGNNKLNSEVLLKENNNEYNKAKSELLLKENGNLIGIKNEGAVHYESEMDKKIAEIRALAREAREKEKLKSEGKGVDEEEENEDYEDDLVPRKLEKSFKKKPLSPADEARKTLMYKKKHRLKSLGIDAKDTKPKGFMGRQDHGGTVIKTNGKLQNGSANVNDFSVLDRNEQFDLPRVDLMDNVSTTSSETDTGRKLPEKETARIQSSPRKKIVKERAHTKRAVTTTEQLNQSQGDVLGSSSVSLEEDKGRKLPAEESIQIQGSRKKYVKERRRTKPSVTASEKSAVQEKPVSVEAQIFRNFIQSKRHDMQESVSKKHDDLNGNGKLKIKEVGTGKANNGLSGQKSYANTDFWWLSLPYVLAIVLRNNSEGVTGLYTLRSTSQGMGDTIRSVAFEDHTDATNFCHILEYFFKELDGFSAGITSIPTKELEEELKSKNMKVLVVKKGQLELYAGQPLTVVEKALRSLVNQN